jgi:hypothetical protein
MFSLLAAAAAVALNVLRFWIFLRIWLDLSRKLNEASLFAEVCCCLLEVERQMIRKIKKKFF